VNVRYPDFKHKKRQEALWLDDRWIPPWVVAEIAALAPGTVPLKISSLNRRLTSYVKAGQYEKTLEVFEQMGREHISPDRFTFVPVLNACANLRALQEGRRVHEQIIQSSCENDVFVGTSLVDMYAKNGSMEDAWRVFNKMPKRNVVSWTAMIQGHVKCGQGNKALELFRQMQLQGVKPNPVTFVGVLNACATAVALEEGRHVHEQILQSGCESDVTVGNSLIDMYAKCGSMEDAWRVFNKMPMHTVVSWTVMILGHVKCGQGQRALELFQQMQLENVQPDPVTFMGVLNACASVLALAEGRLIHQQIVQCGCESAVFVGNSLIDMYTKCGSMEDAWAVFNKMCTRDVVSWNAMILGHVKCGQGKKALELFQQMRREGVQPDPLTFVGVLNACASIAALAEGMQVHQQIIQNGCESDLFVGNSLIDMYAKSGSMEKAWRVFNKMPSHDLVSWNAMLGGFAMHGQIKEVLTHFELMPQEVVDADNITFVGLLSACSHGGLMEEGLHYFNIMGLVYNVSATVEHCVCMVDLLGRAGHLQEAENFIKTMLCESSISVWTALLGACRIHGEVRMAERIANIILEIDPGNAMCYAVLSNIYAAAGKWNLSHRYSTTEKETGCEERAVLQLD
jgi:pentatricopeptide repeat protein